MPGATRSTPGAVPAFAKDVTHGLAVNLHGSGHALRYSPIEDVRSVDQRLDLSLVPPDRSLFEVAVRRSIGNWVFFAPAAIGVMWLATVISDLAVVTSVLLSVLVLGSLLPALAAVALAAPKLFLRLFTRDGRRGYLWFCCTTLMALLDCAVYGTCLFLLARVGGYAHLLPL